MYVITVLIRGLESKENAPDGYRRQLYFKKQRE